MSEVLKSHEGVLPSARQNGDSSSLDYLNTKAKEREKQCEKHEKIEQGEHKKAETELEKGLQDIGVSFFDEEVETHTKDKLKVLENITVGDQIINFKNQLTQQGKPSTEILQTLITKYENEEAVSTWVKNWKQFLKLHLYAEGKPPLERRAIQKIISNADFAAEDSFETALSEIQNNSEISIETKTDLQRKFASANISTVSDLDSALTQIKDHIKVMEKQIEGKEKENKSLKTEISDIEDELESLPLDDPKREELESTLKQKQNSFENNVLKIETLEAEKPESISFTLRENFLAQQNPNGSRSIRIGESSYEVLLPDNTLFMSRKNMLSINLAFTFNALNQIGMDAMFSPKLKSGEVPDKQQRLFGSRILKQLGYPTDQILSQSNLHQLEKDLKILKKKGSSTGVEDLQELRILDEKLDVNFARLDSCLVFVRENRGRGIGFDEVKEQINS